jgi:hypothetical protein
MRYEAIFGSSALWAVAACIGLAACGGQRDQELRLSEELGRARADAAWHEARAAELGVRVSQLEQRVASDTANRVARERELESRLDRMTALQERVVASAPERQPPPATVTEKVAPPLESKAETESARETESALEAELRSTIERLRGEPGRFNRPLTRRQSAALRVLLKPERQLDSENPWQEPWY